MQKITTFLWFDDQAEEAANHYASIFKNAKVLNVHRTGGKVLTVTFDLEGQQFIALNGGPLYRFTEAISLFVDCDGQQEVDELWEKLCAGGEPGRCGWLKDKYGVSWQIIPKALMKLLGDPNPKKSQAVMQAMLKMNKLVVEDLQKAYDGEAAA
jgi:predicted 3-demethylubiquinone-9 3-methyltransferase (glyoxalase superfamily)